MNKLLQYRYNRKGTILNLAVVGCNVNGIDYEYSQYLLRYGKFITDDFIGNARIRIIRAPFSGLYYHKMVNGEVVKLVSLTSANQEGDVK